MSFSPLNYGGLPINALIPLPRYRGREKFEFNTITNEKLHHILSALRSSILTIKSVYYTQIITNNIMP